MRSTKSHLHDGQADKVLEQRRELCIWRSAKAQGQRFDYSEQRRPLLAYRDSW